MSAVVPAMGTAGFDAFILDNSYGLDAIARDPRGRADLLPLLDAGMVTGEAELVFRRWAVHR